MTAILGRMATYSGKIVKWDEALNMGIDLSPASYDFTATPPVLPDKDGAYPVAIPGKTEVVKRRKNRRLSDDDLAHIMRGCRRLFHPVIAAWFAERFGTPTAAQEQSWPSIVGGQHTLVAAPTGSGKTLAAFLASIDSLLRQAVDNTLSDETQVVYVSPLKALSNDIHRNLQVPLEEIRAAALAAGLAPHSIRVAVRTGDTPAKRAAGDGPQSAAYSGHDARIALPAADELEGREILRNVRTVIVDEIHALARDKRGSHLTLSLARLDELCAGRQFESDSRQRNGRLTKSRDSWSAPTMSLATASQVATSSTRGTSANWILPSKFRRASCPPSARSKRGRKSTRGSAN